MPKQQITLNQFHGGLNTEASVRDILQNEFSVLENVNIDHIGRIKTIGGLKSVSFSITGIDELSSGYGLYVFGMDEDSSSASASATKDFIAIAGVNSSGKYVCRVYQNDSSPTNTGELVINDGSIDTGEFYPVFTFVDNGLRVSDGNLDNTHSESQWIGYIDYVFFDSTNKTYGGSDSSGYSTMYSEIKKPTYSYSDSSDTVSLKTTAAFYPGGTTSSGRVVVELNPSTGGGTWDFNNIYSFYASYIYEEKQESLLTFIGDSEGTSTSYNSISLSVYAHPPVISTNNRITGMRIYYTVEETDEYYYLAEVKFDREDGVRWYNRYGEIDAWADDGSGVSKTSTLSDMLDPPTLYTYETNTGIDNNKFDTISIAAKDMVLANNQCYAGGVLYDGKLYGDSIFKSFVYRYDTFISDRRLDVATNDGESVVALESFADRLLEFKEKTLYIINISQDVEFLEDTKYFMGVTKPYHIFKTEFGIAWINSFGAYLYDGKQVHELLKKNGIRVISMDTWNNFFSETCKVGYNPTWKKLVIIEPESGDMMLFSLDTGAWVEGKSLAIDKDHLSNMQIDWNNKLIMATDNSGSIEFYEWDDNDIDSSTRSIDIRTKDFDFGNNNAKNNVYKIVISYTGGGIGTDASVYYSTDGKDSWTEAATKLDSTSVIQTTVGIEPASIIKDIYSVQLRISGTVHKDFEINDIGIIFRSKKVH